MARNMYTIHSVTIDFLFVCFVVVCLFVVVFLSFLNVFVCVCVCVWGGGGVTSSPYFLVSLFSRILPCGPAE